MTEAICWCEVGETEDGRRKLEAGSWELGVGSRKLEVRRPKFEAGSLKREVRSKFLCELASLGVSLRTLRFKWAGRSQKLKWQAGQRLLTDS